MIQVLAFLRKAITFVRSYFSARFLPASWLSLVWSKMDEPQNREDSWDTLSTVLPNLEISLSQDSCYASDEASVPSAITTVAATANVSSPVAPAKLPLAPVLKSILKKPCAELEAEDTESESGYESDASGSQYDASSDCDFSASQDFDGGKLLSFSLPTHENKLIRSFRRSI